MLNINLCFFVFYLGWILVFYSSNYFDSLILLPFHMPQ
ncbi:hypothetical protein SAMD00023520_01903 [Listeria monocytogenes]|nr:hypothetical protein SAMD00023520_01903 [Listeria monocytogenes]